MKNASFSGKDKAPQFGLKNAVLFSILRLATVSNTLFPRRLQ